MSDWVGITDDNLPYPEVADGALAASKDFGAGLAELSGYRREDDERKHWTCAAFDVDGVSVAVHVDWEMQELVVARSDGGEDRP